MPSAHSVRIYLRKLSALVVETLPLALATCGETAEDLWFAQMSLLALLAGVSGVVRAGILGSTPRWSFTRSGYFRLCQSRLYLLCVSNDGIFLITSSNPLFGFW